MKEDWNDTQVTLAKPFTKKCKNHFTLDFEGQVPRSNSSFTWRNKRRCWIIDDQWYPKWPIRFWRLARRSVYRSWISRCLGNFDVKITIELKYYVLGGSGYLAKTKTTLVMATKMLALRCQSTKNRKQLTWHFMLQTCTISLGLPIKTICNDVIKRIEQCRFTLLYKTIQR